MGRAGIPDAGDRQRKHHSAGLVPVRGTRVPVLFNCRTTLVDDFRGQFADLFAYEKNRAILLDAREPLPEAPLRSCLGMALTYHRRR